MGLASVLLALASKISDSHEALSAHTCGNLFTMLLNKGHCSEVNAMLDVFVNHVARVCHQLSVQHRNHARKVLEGMTGDVPDKMRAVLSPVLEGNSVEKSSDSALAAGWSEHEDGKGGIFYHHKIHGSQWHCPFTTDLPVG